MPTSPAINLVQPTQNQHIIILPYYSDEEVDRYLKIAERIKTFPQPKSKIHFLLANSPKREPSQRLREAFQGIAPCTLFACPSQVFGYPQGPTAMYWDTMEYIAENFAGNEGFSLWLESDMAPDKENWIDRLSDEWFSGETPLMMGCYVPDVYKHRIFRKPKLLLNAHVNGGACYACDFAKRMPKEARTGVFDMAVYQYAAKLDRVRQTRQIAFSTLDRVRRDVADPNKVLLHGFMQEKDSFIEQCLAPISQQELQHKRWHQIQEHIEYLKRRVRVQFVRRGHRAMLENMMIAKKRLEDQQDELAEQNSRSQPMAA